jgi:membrane protease YdiL (CAAX protease family)
MNRNHGDALPHPTDSARSDRLLAAALLLWLVYFGSLRLTRALLAVGLTGEPFADLRPDLYFVPVVIGHAISLGVAWLTLSRIAGGPAAVLRGDWAKARGALARLGMPPKGRYALGMSVYAGVMTWAFVTLAATNLPQTSGTTTFNAAAGGALGHRLFVALLATCTAPLIEELYYRGFLLTQLRLAAGRASAVLLVTTLFAAQHMGQYRDADGLISWPSVFAVTASGLVMALLRLGTGSLAPGVIVHAVYNAFNTVLFGLLLRPHG